MSELPSEIAISVQDVSKYYKLGVINRSTFRDELLYRWYRLRGIDPSAHLGKIQNTELQKKGLFHALDHVSFDIATGETVGLIGRNGAGKSTMLKILARITAPNTGRATIRGRVGSLLEVGTGFHPELTGRENIYMNGMILGMSKEEIDSKFDEIVDFSEIGSFLDTPVKRYSSGMYVKLAFSVAASLDTDILLIDEVLAVGDAAFRAKSLNRMKQIAADGRTILIVSHSMGNVKEICSRCILFDHGKVLADGPTEEVTNLYSKMTLPKSDGMMQNLIDDTCPVYPTKVEMSLDPQSHQWNLTIACTTALDYQWSPRVIASIRRKGTTGTSIIVLDSACAPDCMPKVVSGKIEFRTKLPASVQLPTGDYTIDLRLASGSSILQKLPAFYGFSVTRSDQLPQGWSQTPAIRSLVHIKHDWSFKTI